MSETVNFTWVAGANERLRYNTRDLIKNFGVADTGQQISLLEINATNTAGASLMFVDVDPRLKGLFGSPRGKTLTHPARPSGGVQTGSDEGDTAIRGRFLIIAADGDNPIPKRLYGMPLRDELHIQATTAQTYNIDITYELVSGNMHLIDDMALNIGDITQVTLDRRPGGPYFQAGKMSQIGGKELPEAQ